ncbi:GNAT family N-acetyltransferase, partial [Klebsiella pneumoniae]
MHIINAEEQHIPAIRRIYAHHVLHGTGSFETEPPDTQEMLARVKNVQSRGFPW